MGDLNRDADPDEGWSSGDAGTPKASTPDERPSRRIVPERTNTPAMPWGISLMPPALTLAEAEPIEPPPPTARPGLAPAPESDPPELPVRAHEPSRDARAGERAMLPARIEREDKDPPKKKVGLVRVGRPVLSSPEPYDLGAQLASHLAWLDDDGRGDLERHLARGDHRKALAMIAKAKSSYPKNVSIGRCAQIVERAAIARLLLRVTPLEAIGRIEGHV